MRKKAKKVWMYQSLKGDDRTPQPGRSLKSVCLSINVSYNTAKKKQNKDGGKTVWVVGEMVYEIWVSKVL